MIEEMSSEVRLPAPGRGMTYGAIHVVWAAPTLWVTKTFLACVKVTQATPAVSVSRTTASAPPLETVTGKPGSSEYDLEPLLYENRQTLALPERLVVKTALTSYRWVPSHLTSPVAFERESSWVPVSDQV